MLGDKEAVANLVVTVVELVVAGVVTFVNGSGE